MNRLAEAVTSFLMRERPLQRFEKEVAEGETASFDVFMKQGVEYVVRGNISRGKALAKVSLAGSIGSMIHVETQNGPTCFSVIPEKDGLYQIRAVVEPTVKKDGPVTLSVSLSAAFPIPTYIMQQSVILSRPAATPELTHGQAGQAAA
jgi:hypothetical protein